MKIASADITMGSRQVLVEIDSTRERLRAWVGKDPDAELRTIRDRVVLGANHAKAPQESTKQKEGGRGSGKGCRVEDDDELLKQGDGNLYMAKKLIEALTGRKVRLLALDPNDLQGKSAPDLPREAQQLEQAGWGVEYDRTITHYELEVTTFAAGGVVRTGDGREIGFSLKLEMSRELMTIESESVRAGDAVKVDPLVLNFHGSAAELTDTKFAFDLDRDGQQENISFVGSGSGVLVFDRNRDGIVNDGGELFGPSTGNGFNELAALDQDENGWIDENDASYQDLSVWTRSEGGEDTLRGLKGMNVGAIYLGNVASRFDIKSGATLNGQVVRTGVFAKEDGGVGTIQQIDLVT
ncbi:MAG: hypothetical protein AB9873_08615 [Syntrophobacteraceae bacterium]